jgi:hypothetical protein
LKTERIPMPNTLAPVSVTGLSAFLPVAEGGFIPPLGDGPRGLGFLKEKEKQ